MPNRERTGWRDYAYSAWHRTLSDRLSFLDLDWVERCDSCSRILAVYELAVDGGRDDKAYWTTQQVARRLDLTERQGTVRGYVVLYTKSGSDITGFRVKRIHPDPQDKYTAMTPDEWADNLYRLRWCHPLTRPQVAPAVVGPRCFTCGSPPSGTFTDGSPRFSCAGSHHAEAS